MIEWIFFLLLDVPGIGLIKEYIVDDDELAVLIGFGGVIFVITAILLGVRSWEVRKEAEKGLIATLDKGNRIFKKSGISDDETSRHPH